MNADIESVYIRRLDSKKTISSPYYDNNSNNNIYIKDNNA